MRFLLFEVCPRAAGRRVRGKQEPRPSSCLLTP